MLCRQRNALAGDVMAQQACLKLLASRKVSSAVTLALTTVISPSLSMPQQTHSDSQLRAAAEQLTLTKPHPPGARHPEPQITWTQTASSIQAQTASIMNMMLQAAVRPLTVHIPNSPASTSDSDVVGSSVNNGAEATLEPIAANATSSADAKCWAEAFAGNVLTVPDLIAQLGSANCDKLTASGTSFRLLTALQQMAHLLGSSNAIIAVGNMVQLLAGARLSPGQVHI